MVKSRLRNLERKLVMERAELQIDLLVEQLVRRWDYAVYQGWSTPDSMEFIEQLLDAGFYLLNANMSTIRYIEECRREDKIPEQKRLLQILLPWAS